VMGVSVERSLCFFLDLVVVVEIIKFRFCPGSYFSVSSHVFLFGTQSRVSNHPSRFKPPDSLVSHYI